MAGGVLDRDRDRDLERDPLLLVRLVRRVSVLITTGAGERDLDRVRRLSGATITRVGEREPELYRDWALEGGRTTTGSSGEPLRERRGLPAIMIGCWRSGDRSL